MFCQSLTGVTSGGSRPGGLDLLAMAAIFPSVISSFFVPKIRGGGGLGPPGPSPRSATGYEFSKMPPVKLPE